MRDVVKETHPKVMLVTWSSKKITTDLCKVPMRIQLALPSYEDLVFLRT